MISTLASYRLTTRDLAQSIKQVSNQPIVSRDVVYYRENITKIKTIEDFISDTRIFNFAMKAHGLGDMAYAKAFMAKVLREGHDDRTSFANRLTDQRYVEFAKTFDFNRYAETATTLTKARDGVIDRYLRQTLEEQAGTQNEGVRLALYFQRKAPAINNYYEILADPALAQVARTVVGLPESAGALDIDKQKNLLEAGFDLADFKEPARLEKFLERFTTTWEVNNGGQSASVQGAGLLFSQGVSFGISQDLMLQIQLLKR